MASLPLETLPDVLRRSPFHRLLGLEMVRAAAGEVVLMVPVFPAAQAHKNKILQWARPAICRRQAIHLRENRGTCEQLYSKNLMRSFAPCPIQIEPLVNLHKLYLSHATKN